MPFVCVCCIQTLGFMGRRGEGKKKKEHRHKFAHAPVKVPFWLRVA